MKPQGLQTNFENKANPGFATEEETYIVINNKGIEVEVPKFVWDDHMKRPQYGWQYLGLKTEQGVKPVAAPEPISEETSEHLGGEKPIKTVKGFKKA